MEKLLVWLDLAEEVGKIEIRGNKKIFQRHFREIPFLHRFENCKLDGCKECNRKERKFTNEELRGVGALRTGNSQEVLVGPLFRV